jgi:ribonucleoside-diphosphate reductase alpha chain
VRGPGVVVAKLAQPACGSWYWEDGPMTISETRPADTTGTVLEGIRSKVFIDRYSLKDENGKPLETTPEEMWRRVARGIAAVEQTEEARHDWEERFYEVMDEFKFVPGGRILSGAGTGFAVTYFNCYVIPSPADSRGGILENLKYLTEIMARGGGVGVNLSTLRPRGSYIKSVNGTSSGPVSWAELYSVITGRVIQQGGTRRGALMIMLDDDHPDIEEFIAAKRIDPLTNKPVTIEHANVSVAVSNAFMQAVKDDADWALQFPTRAAVAADPSLASTVKVHSTVKARTVWDLICTSAWTTAEPGLVFMDRYNERSNTWYYENIRCVNPCGEQGLPEWGVCNLGAINLSAYAHGPIGSATFDYAALAEDSRVAMRFLDNVVDANEYFLPENEAAQMGTRRTGLGTMGLADALIKMGLAYGSEESTVAIEKIYRTIRDAAYDMSADIAAEKGPAPHFDFEKYPQGQFIQELPAAIQAKIKKQGIRNAVLLTQAPTGTTSLLSGVSSGIEPVFSFAMKRVDRTGEHMMYHPLLEEWRADHPGEETPDYFVSSSQRGTSRSRRRYSATPTAASPRQSTRRTITPSRRSSASTWRRSTRAARASRTTAMARAMRC